MGCVGLGGIHVRKVRRPVTPLSGRYRTETESEEREKAENNASLGIEHLHTLPPAIPWCQSIDEI